MKKIVIIMIIGALLFAWGVGTSKYTTWDENIKIASGKIAMEEGARDPDFEVYVPSPILHRNVEMYRYYVTHKATENESERWDVGWVSEEDGITPSGKSNPKWPEDLHSRTFYGDVRLIDSGFYMSDEVLDHFCSSYVYLETEYGKLRVKNLSKEAGEEKGMTLVGDDCFTDSGKEPKIGDIRITYWAIDPAILEKEYTVVGFAKEGVIGVHEGDYVSDEIYDKIIPPEELKKDREESNTAFSVAFRIIGAILFAGPLLILVLKSIKKKERNETS